MEKEGTAVTAGSVRKGSLNTKWKELLFAASGFGPNFFMVLMGAFFSDAVNPAGLMVNVQGQTIFGTVCLVIPAVFSVLMILSKVFDGIIDIPMASISDNLSTKWGRRRPPIAICFVPMVLSYAMCWVPAFGTSAGGQVGNTVWFFVWAMIFFATYTMCLIAFYGSISNVCTDTAQRLRVSAFKSFFDTISYCLVYALTPVIMRALYNGMGWGIDMFVFLSLPLMCTMLVPLFLIKEGKKYGYPENDGFVKQPKMSLIESFKTTFRVRSFRSWLIVNCCSFFGLQMFLVAMNTMIIGGMGMSAIDMMILNTCAFAPVPIMLYLFRKCKDRYGIRITYQSCLLAFAVSILTFFFGSTFICGTNNKALQMIIGCTGGVTASWAIGAFFMMPYMISSQISSVEEKVTKKNHSAMYFAVQAFTSSIAGALASYGVYDVLKNLFVTKDFAFTWAEAGNGMSALEVASQQLGVGASGVYNFGVMLVPFIVSIMCVVGFLVAFKMPKHFSAAEIARDFKRIDPTLDISGIEAEEQTDKKETVFVQIALSVLSGFIFGFVWLGFLIKSLRELIGKKLNTVTAVLSCFVPFLSIFVCLKLYGALDMSCYGDKAQQVVKRRKLTAIVTSIFFPLLPINIVALAFLQCDVNAMFGQQSEQLEKPEPLEQPEQQPAAELAEENA